METFLLLGTKETCNCCGDSLREKQDKSRSFNDTSHHIKTYRKLGRECKARSTLFEAQSDIFSKALPSITNGYQVRLLKYVHSS